MTTNIGVTIFAKIAHIGLTIVLSILLFVLTPYSRFITVRANYYLFFFSVSKIFEVHSSYLRDRCYLIKRHAAHQNILTIKSNCIHVAIDIIAK